MTSLCTRAGLRPLGWFAIIVGIITACAVGADRAQAQTVQAAAPFTSDRLSVEVVGAGPDLILIPGLASSREVWRATADRLKATHRVHLVQLAGFAGQPWSHGDGPFVEPVVVALDAYIRSQGLERPAIVGHSLGGLVGLRLAQTHPDAVGRLMSVDSLPFYSAMFGPTATAESAEPFAAQASAMILNSPDEAFRASQAQTATTLARDPATRAAMVEWAMASDRHAAAAAMRDVMTTDARPGLAAMTTPVTALYAADGDGGAPAAMADALWTQEYGALPGVKLVRVDDSRHFIMADQPERFAERLDAFLAE